jgi:hypothetical protein
MKWHEKRWNEKQSEEVLKCRRMLSVNTSAHLEILRKVVGKRKSSEWDEDKWCL